MSYSITDSDANCYPGSTVLINKLGIRSQTNLDEVEKIVTTLHAAQIESDPPEDPFTFAFYLKLHQRLFEDLYDWAGTLRTVDLSKQGTVFVSCKKLDQLGNAIFARLQNAHDLRGLSRRRLALEAADLYNTLNLLHPFREGNGRVQRLFFTLLIRRAGYEIHFSKCDSDELMIATIYAAQGVMDHLNLFFLNAIQKKEDLS